MSIGGTHTATPRKPQCRQPAPGNGSEKQVTRHTWLPTTKPRDINNKRVTPERNRYPSSKTNTLHVLTRPGRRRKGRSVAD